MIQPLPRSAGKVIGFRASGRLDDDDYKNEIIPRLERIITHGKARLLLWLDVDFAGWSLGGMWDDAKWGLAHGDDFEKIAVVGAPKWLEWGVKLDGLIMNCQVRFFAVTELERAWRWIEA